MQPHWNNPGRACTRPGQSGSIAGMSSLLALVLAAAPAVLTLDVQPSDTVIKVDGQRKGTAEKVTKVKLTPGRHLLRFERKGEAHEEEVRMKSGEARTFKWAFEGGAPAEKAEPAATEAPRATQPAAAKDEAKEFHDEDIPLEKL